MGYLKRGLLDMMNLSNDLNLLAANNVIGYDTYSNTLGGMGYGRYNPYGTGKINVGPKKDIYVPNSTQKYVAQGAGLAGGLLLGTKILNAVSKTGKSKNKSFWKCLKNEFKNTAKKTTKTTSKKVAQTGFKGVLAKVGKGCKITAIVAGIGAIAAGGLKLYQAIKMKNMPLNAEGQPQDRVSFSNSDPAQLQQQQIQQQQIQEAIAHQQAVQQQVQQQLNH